MMYISTSSLMVASLKASTPHHSKKRKNLTFDGYKKDKFMLVMTSSFPTFVEWILCWFLTWINARWSRWAHRMPEIFCWLCSLSRHGDDPNHFHSNHGSRVLNRWGKHLVYIWDLGEGVRCNLFFEKCLLRGDEDDQRWTKYDQRWLEDNPWSYED